MSRRRQLCECGRPATYWSKRHGRRRGGGGHGQCRQCWRAEMDRMGRGQGQAARGYLVGVVEFGRAMQLARRRGADGEPPNERVMAVVHKALCLGLDELERRKADRGAALLDGFEGGGGAADERTVLAD